VTKKAWVLITGALLAGACLATLSVNGPSASAAAPGGAGGMVASDPSALQVLAGVDRDVVIPGKTYLSGRAGYNLNPPAGRRGGGGGGAARGARGPAVADGVTVAWSKESGPGTVTFADAAAGTTTATFSTPGAYVLKLTAKNDATTVTSTLACTALLAPPKEQLDAVNTLNFKVDSPLWTSRVKSLIAGWIPHCIDEINDSSLSQGGIDNFVEAGKKLRGEPAARHKGYPFSNAWVHQTVESMSIALMVDAQGDKDMLAAQDRMRKTLDEWIPIILAAQEPDGYLQTRFTLNGGNHWDPRTRGEHEGYVAGYFLESAINHYNMTNRKDARLYNAAKKLADCWCDNIGPATEKNSKGEPKKVWYDGHQEMEQALVRFGRYVNDIEGAGKGQKYINLAKFLLDSRAANGVYNPNGEYDQSHVPVIQQYEAVGHAVRASYTYSGMADVAVETHDVDYQSAVMSLFDNLTNKKWYVTGGIGSGETSEGFGPNYSLPNNAYCESCSTCGTIFFLYKMNLAYQDAKYVDLYEDGLYNALLGATDLKGTIFNYTNPLVGGNRTAWHNCPCCVGNIPRTLLMIPTWSYGRSADSILVNLFIGSTATIENIAGTNVQMVQKTNYPWDGKVSITVNPEVSKNFAIKVRVPDRGVSALYTAMPKVEGVKSFTVNGATASTTVDKGYLTVTRQWQKGDKIDVEFPMAVQRVKADPRVTADAGRVALRYGPLIYSFESVDNGDINKALSPASALAAQFKPDMFKAFGDAPEGATIITGKFADGSDLKAIPYYARLNRVAESGNAPPASAAAPGRAGRGAPSRFGQSAVWISDR
jgi:uncharacterized protein